MPIRVVCSPFPIPLIQTFLLSGLIVLGRNIDMQSFIEVINLQEIYAIKFPDTLKGSLGFQRCSCIIKRTRPVWWQANGIKITTAKELITCRA